MLRAGFIMCALDASVALREVQIATRHADPRTTTVYDHRRQNFDKHPAYVVVAFVAGGWTRRARGPVIPPPRPGGGDMLRSGHNRLGSSTSSARCGAMPFVELATGCAELVSSPRAGSGSRRRAGRSRRASRACGPRNAQWAAGGAHCGLSVNMEPVSRQPGAVEAGVGRPGLEVQVGGRSDPLTGGGVEQGGGELPSGRRCAATGAPSRRRLYRPEDVSGAAPQRLGGERWPLVGGWPSRPCPAPDRSKRALHACAGRDPGSTGCRLTPQLTTRGPAFRGHWRPFLARCAGPTT